VFLDMATVLRSHALWLAHEPGGVRADLRSRHLAGADLAGADLREAALSGADLRQASLAGARLERAELRYIDLSGSDLRQACLAGANLRGGCLRGADLAKASFTRADLAQVDLEGARMSWFDPDLVGERLWQAAGECLEHRMVAAFVGRSQSWCWDDYGVLPPRQRLWVLQQFRRWVQPGDEAPNFIKLASAARLDDLPSSPVAASPEAIR
jgi:hypothetical protein